MLVAQSSSFVFLPSTIRKGPAPFAPSAYTATNAESSWQPLERYVLPRASTATPLGP